MASFHEKVNLTCQSCGAKYVLKQFNPDKKYGCKHCSASLLFGKFAFQEQLGRGGFGTVYKALQVDLQRTVAVKILHADSDEATDRFIREARIAANLTHPNIAPIFEVGEHDGKPFISMQFVDGTTVNKAQLDTRDAVKVIRDAAVAVEYAHARNIVHRDIKPHNIMIARPEESGLTPGDQSRRVFVMDFGLARSVGGGGTLTTEGQLLGTPAYMSPEQAEGLEVGPSSDIYSLGATLYSLVTKHAPFEANTPIMILKKVTEGRPRPPSKVNDQVDPHLDQIILKSMEVDAEKRYASAGKFAQDLTNWLEGKTPDIAPTLQIPSGGTKETRHKTEATKPYGDQTKPTIQTEREVATADPSASSEPHGSQITVHVAPHRGLAIAAVIGLLVVGALIAGVILMQKKDGPKDPDDFVAIRIDTIPDGAIISIPGTNLSWKAPAKVWASEIKSLSDIELKVEAPGHRATMIPVQYTKDKPFTGTARLEPLTSVVFTVTTEPEGATIRVRGVAGEWKSPHEFTNKDLPAGTHEFEITLDGYEIHRESGKVPDDGNLTVTLKKSSRKIAFTVTSEPAGARVFVDGTQIDGETPVTLYQDELRTGPVPVRVEKRGYIAKQKSVSQRGASVKIHLELEKETGSFLVKSAEPGANWYLFEKPDKVQDLSRFLMVWSLKEIDVLAALRQLDQNDRSFMVERIRELQKSDLPDLAKLAASLSTISPSTKPVRPLQSGTINSTGAALLEDIAIGPTYVLYVTSKRSQDFMSTDLTPIKGQQLVVRANMPRLAILSFDMRPPVGHFEILNEKKQVLGSMKNDARKGFIAPGRYIFRFIPPSGEKILVVSEKAWELHPGREQVITGSLYNMAGHEYMRNEKWVQSIHAYTAYLREKTFPVREQEARDKLPDRIRKIYRDLIESELKKGHKVRRDFQKLLKNARAQPAPQAIPALMFLYCADNLDEASRMMAAGALMEKTLSIRSPFEAMEWFERVLEGRFDPKRLVPELEGQVKELDITGLNDRWTAAMVKLAELRNVPPPEKKGELVGRVNFHRGKITMVRFRKGAPIVRESDTLEIYRDGKKIGELDITQMIDRKATYPDGGARCELRNGRVAKGDEVRTVPEK